VDRNIDLRALAFREDDELALKNSLRQSPKNFPLADLDHRGPPKTAERIGRLYLWRTEENAVSSSHIANLLNFCELLRIDL